MADNNITPDRQNPPVIYQPPEGLSLCGAFCWEYRNLKTTTQSCPQYCKGLIKLISPVVYAIVWVTFFAFFLSLLIVGIVHKDNCPVYDKIPIWLIVFSAIGFFRLILSYRAYRLGKRHGPMTYTYDGTTFMDIVMLICCIFGLVWARTPDKIDFRDTVSDHYCERMTFELCRDVSYLGILVFPFHIAYAICCKVRLYLYVVCCVDEETKVRVAREHGCNVSSSSEIKWI